MCSMSGAWFFISAIRGLMKTSDQMGRFSSMHRLHHLLQVVGFEQPMETSSIASSG